MPVELKIKLDVASMAEFMLYHIYTGPVGILTLILGVLNAGSVVVFASRREWALMFLFLVFVFLIVVALPMFIRYRVAKQMENSRRAAAEVTYIFSDDGIETITEEDRGKASWTVFKKAVSRKEILILYAKSGQAIILPVSQIEAEYTAVVDLIFAHMPAPAVRIRRTDGKK